VDLGCSRCSLPCFRRMFTWRPMRTSFRTFPFCPRQESLPNGKTHGKRTLNRWDTKDLR
jgi:hypothetical protein